MPVYLIVMVKLLLMKIGQDQGLPIIVGSVIRLLKMTVKWIVPVLGEAVVLLMLAVSVMGMAAAVQTVPVSLMVRML